MKLHAESDATLKGTESDLDWSGGKFDNVSAEFKNRTAS